MTPAAPGPRMRPPQPANPRRVRAALTLEDQVRFAYFVPDPTAYGPPNTHSQSLGAPKAFGKISSSVHPSPLDHAARSTAHVPGPGSYSAPDLHRFALPEGGRLNRNPPVEKVKYFDEYPQPGPGQNGIPEDPTRPRLVHGAFGRDKRVSKYIMDEVNRSKNIPGPGAHDVLESMDALDPFCPEGGRTMGQGKPGSYFDAATSRYKDNPDPGAYTLQSGLKTNTAVGKVVYRYESATMSETKDLVNRIAGGMQEAPGPGAYDVPDPQPSGPVPSLKGRSLPFAMPHPFAYNCAPDTLGKYSSSVLNRNSSDMIFGTGVRKGGRGSRTKPGSPDPNGDLVEEKQLPVEVGPLAAEQPESQVEWRAGGFASLKKTRSSSSPQQKPEHPLVREAAKCYPMLQRKHRSASSFLPMASRRSESVGTHATSEECERLRCGKWQLGALANGLHQATAAALEPLDVDKLKRDAIKVLELKAKERMSLEGVSRAKQQVVLEEMRSVMHEKVKPAPPAEAPAASPGSGGLAPQAPQLDPGAAAMAGTPAAEDIDEGAEA